MRILVRALWPPVVALALSLWLAPAASAVDIDWVTVGDPGNAADTTGFGAVSYAYRISETEVTNAQYAEFLNAKAASDALGLYHPGMAGGWGGITRNGSSGSYTYSAIAGRGDMPVNYVSFYDALRFSNWLHNGQGSGDTETGAYTLLGGAIPSNGLTVTRNTGARFFLPSEDEWYKAAYYDPLSASYFDYPAGSDVPMVCAAPGATANTANCAMENGDVTDVGSYTGSASPNGTFDQGGNVWEWNEAIIDDGLRGQRGGSFVDFIWTDLGAEGDNLEQPVSSDHSMGLRVASPAPAAAVPSLSPLGVALLSAGLAMAGLRRLRRFRWLSNET